MGNSKSPPHVFIVSYPAQGQINPLLRLAKRLASTGGFLVTFSTTSTAGKRITNANGFTPGRLYPVGDGFLRFDLFEIGAAPVTNRSQFPEFYPKLVSAGRSELPKMIRRVSDEGLPPVTCIINGNVLPWVADVAQELRIPLATLWAQSCSSFLTFYYYYNQLVPFPTQDHPYTDVQIPTLPLLKWDELNSFLHPSYFNPSMRDAWLQEFDNLDKPFCILMDSFSELEADTCSFTAQICPAIKCVGPLFRDPINQSLEIKSAADVSYSCLDWLDAQPLRSVVYICFGSMTHLKQDQVDEIAHGIINSRVRFLWVVRTPDPNSGFKPHTLPENMGGLVVECSPQEKVLDHPSVACFVTHCGWNSTMESLASGVPMVAFPQWGDQVTDAKFLVDVLGVAVRMGRGEQSSKVVSREEVERCIREATTGPKAEEMRAKAMTWKDKAEKAYQEGGSSNTNFHAFVDVIRHKSSTMHTTL